MKTFTFHLKTADSAPLMDGIAGLFNNSPGHIVEVVDIRVAPGGGEAKVGASAMELRRCTQAGTGELVTPSKHDTDSPDLPSQVTFTVENTVDVTTSDVVSRYLSSPAFSSTLANAGMAACQPGMWWPGYTWSTADVFRAQQGTEVEPIVLREGEGLCIVQTAFGKPHAGVIGLLVRNLSTGATYTYRSRDVGTPRRLTMPQFVLFNGSGSGVVLQVIVVEQPDDGEATTTSGFRLALIDGYVDATTTDAVSAHDTNNALPAGIVGLSGPFRAVPAGNALGIEFDWWSTHGSTMTLARQHAAGRIRRRVIAPTGVDTGSALGVMNYGYAERFFNARCGGCALILRPGSGIALLDGVGGSITSSTFSFFEVAITFLVRTSDANTGNAYVS